MVPSYIDLLYESSGLGKCDKKRIFVPKTTKNLEVEFFDKYNTAIKKAIEAGDKTAINHLETQILLSTAVFNTLDYLNIYSDSLCQLKESHRLSIQAILLRSEMTELKAKSIYHQQYAKLQAIESLLILMITQNANPGKKTKRKNTRK